MNPNQAIPAPYPYWLAARGPRSIFYQPPEIELPAGGDPIHQSFSWSTENGGLGLPVMDSQESTRTIGQDLIWWGINGNFSGAGVFVQIIHTRDGKQRPIANKPRPLDSIAGSGSRPFLLSKPYPLKAGDSITVEVKSLDKVNAQTVEVLLLCNSIPKQ